MLITKQQVLDRTRISVRISDKQINPFIQDAQEYDLPTLLPGDLITAAVAMSIDATGWTAGTPYPVNAYAVYGNVYYKALSETTGVIPGTDAAIWQPDYKATLRYLYLPDFLIWNSYRRFLLETGRTPTEAGLTVATDPEGTYTQASDKARSELMQAAADKANFHRAKINGFLKEYKLITSNTCSPAPSGRSGRVTAI